MDEKRFVGYKMSNEERDLFSPQSIERIAAKASGMFKENRVHFKQDVVRNLLEKNYYDYKPPTTDIYSKYLIKPFTQDSKVDRVVEQTVQMLVSEAQTQILGAQYVNSLDINVLKFADDLAAVPQVKLRLKRPQTMAFFQNY